MANTDNAFGLKPVGDMSGSPYNGAITKFHVPASDGTAIFIGGLVKPAGSADAEGIMSVTGNVATGDAVIGVVVGVDAMLGAGANGRDSTTHRAASTERYVYAATDPNALFEVQSDGVGGALVAGDIGNSADLTGFTAGSTIFGTSTIEIDTSTATASGDGTQDVVILGVVPRADNELSTNVKCYVRLNNHYLVDAQAGA